MRTQTTVYLYPGTKQWLKSYRKKLGLRESEIIRILLEREQAIRWLQWALRQKDPSMPGAAAKMRRGKDTLPRRWNKPPNARPAKRR